MATSDLLPKNLSLSSSNVTQGGPLTVNWTMLNQGAGTAPATTTGVRITTSSTDHGNATNDVGSQSTQQLTSGASVAQNLTITVPSNETVGTDYVWVVADNENPATGNQGSNTANDFQLVGSIQVSAPSSFSDLLPKNLSLSSSSVTQGGPLTVNWTMLNQGAGTAPATTTGVRITTSSTDHGNATNDVGSQSTQQLTSGASVAQNLTITVPSNETVGTDYVWVVADNENPATGNQGSNTANDFQLVGSIQVSAPSSFSDLLPKNLSLSSSNVTQGGPLTVNWTMLNQGAGTAPATTTGVRITTSSTDHGNATNDVGSQSTQQLTSGASVAQNLTITVPSNETVGTDYVWVVADNENPATGNQGSNTANDFQLVGSIQVSAPSSFSDLLPKNLSLSSSNVTQGGPLTVNWTMLNQGAGTAPATTTGVRITTSSTDHGNATNDVGSQSTQQLTSGASVAQNLTITVPSNETVGTDYVWVVADNENPATGNQGSNTANDFQLVGSIQVSAPSSFSDLLPKNLSLSSSNVTQGGPLTVNWTMLNQGAGTAPATTTGVRITTSSTDHGNATNDVGSQSTQQLTSGASVAQNLTITVPSNETVGTDYVWVVADNENPATGNQGSNTANDFQLVGSIQVSAPSSFSDLLPKNLSLSSSNVTQGGPLTVNWTMLNQGAGTAPATTTGVRITTSSTDHGNATNDVGSQSTQQLTSGASVAQNLTITVPSNETVGTDYVWVVADNENPATGNQGSNTANDFQLVGSIQVSAPSSFSDLLPKNLSLSSSNVTQGGPLTVNWTMLNQGAGTAPATTTGVRITTSSTDHGNATNDVGSQSTQQLTSGASVAQNLTITVPSNETVGTDYVWVVADNENPATGNQGSNTANDFQLVGSIQVSAPSSSGDNILDNVNTSGLLSTTTSSTIDSTPASGSTTNVSNGKGGFVDKDWFKVTLNKGEIYTFSGTSQSITTGLMDISLYGSSGSQVHAAVEGANPSFTFDTTYQTSATQTYYLAVSAGGPDPAWRTATGNYSLSLTAQAVNTPPADNIPATTATTATLPVNGTTPTVGTIDSSDVAGGPDDDYYMVTLTGGHKYTFIASAGVSASDTLDSVFIRLHDSSGAPISTGNTSASGSNPSFDFTAPGSGQQTYYFAISASSSSANETGQYSLTLKDDGVPSSGSTTTTPTTVSGHGETLTSSGPVVAGFDWVHNPGSDAMAYLLAHTNLREVGYYLGKKIDATDVPGIISEGQTQHGTNVSNTNDFSWMGTLSSLSNWLVAPIYVGQQDPAYVTNNGLNLYDQPDQSMGTIDADETIKLLQNQGFAQKTVVYLDWETGGSITTDEAQYFVAWVAEISKSNYLPGIYTPYSAAPNIEKALTDAGYSATFWASDINGYIKNPTNFQPNGGNFLIADPSSIDTSGFADAVGWQYRGPAYTDGQNVKHATTFNLFDLGSDMAAALNHAGISGSADIDLDTFRTSAWATISSDASQDAPIVGNNGLLSVQGGSAGSNVTLGSQATNGVISNSLTGDVQYVFSQFSELLFDGGVFNDIVHVLPLSAAGIANHTVFFNGNDGNDVLDGSATDTTIVASGGTGDDTLIGGPNNDVLDGNAGADTLTGGHGADAFVFDFSALSDGRAATPVIDHITDYDQGNTGTYALSEGDQIDLSALLASAYNLGDGQPVGTLVKLMASGNGADLLVNPDGSGWATIAHLDGIRGDETLNVIMDSTQPSGVQVAVPGPAISGDFDGNGHIDILWQNDNGTVSIWDNGQISGAHGIAPAGLIPNSWHIVGSGDFDGNHQTDILWQNDNGTVSIWDNGQISGAHAIANAGVIPSSWHIVGTGDFDGNGKSDILWQNDNGTVSIWDNGQISGAHAIAPAGLIPNSWHIVGTGDFDGNGKTDILWQNDNGTVSIWDNGQISGAHWIANPGVIPNNWHIVGTGDFDGNGKTDILWQNDNGTVSIWDNGQISGAHWIANPGDVPNSSHIVGTGDFDANGHTDILWQDENGAVSIWDNGQLSGAHVIANAGVIPASWHIA